MNWMKWIGIILLSIWQAYTHPCTNLLDYLFLAFFWFGLVLYVNGIQEDE